MKVRMNFAHRIDMWDDNGENIVEQLAGIEDCEYSQPSRSVTFNLGWTIHPHYGRHVRDAQRV